MEGLPKDPVILLSYINTQLRDYFTDLDELCQEKGIGRRKLEEMLLEIDYEYDVVHNQFI